MTLEQRLTAIAQAIGADIKALFAAPGGARGVHVPEPVIAGAYTNAAVNAGALTTLAMAANRLDFIPFVPMRNVTVSELAVEVTTAVASSQARVGIYDSTAGGLPGNLLTGQGTALDGAAVGAKTSAVANVTLLAGATYWLAVHASSTQTLRAMALASVMSLGAAATGTAVYSLRRATVTFASGLPATAPATTLTSSIVPWVRIKLA